MLKTGCDFHKPAIDNDGEIFKYREKSKGEKGKQLGNGKRLVLPLNSLSKITTLAKIRQTSRHMPINGKTVHEHRLKPIFLINTFDQMPEA